MPRPVFRRLQNYALTRRRRMNIPAALTRPDPISIRLLGSGVGTEESNVKLTFPLAVLVRLNVPGVASKPFSVNVPKPVTFRKLESS